MHRGPESETEHEGIVPKDCGSDTNKKKRLEALKEISSSSQLCKGSGLATVPKPKVSSATLK